MVATGTRSALLIAVHLPATLPPDVLASEVSHILTARDQGYAEWCPPVWVRTGSGQSFGSPAAERKLEWLTIALEDAHFRLGAMDDITSDRLVLRPIGLESARDVLAGHRPDGLTFADDYPTQFSLETMNLVAGKRAAKASSSGRSSSSAEPTASSSARSARRSTERTAPPRLGMRS